MAGLLSLSVPSAAPPGPDYTTDWTLHALSSGNRNDHITITANSGVGLAVEAERLLDGSRVASSAGSTYFNGDWAADDDLQFDFEVEARIDGARLVKNDTSNQGTWIFERETAPDVWEAAGDSFVWTGGDLDALQGGYVVEVDETNAFNLIGASDVSTSWRMRKVSGTNTSGPWLMEIEFRVSRC